MDLNEILRRYEVTLVDTCALINPIGKNADMMDIKRREAEIKDNHILREKLLDALNRNDSLFITTGVAGEYNSRNHFNYQGKIKTLDKEVAFTNQNYGGGMDRRETLEFYRHLRDSKKEKMLFLHAAEYNGRILELSTDQNKIYRGLDKKYHALMIQRGLSKENIELLLSGIVIAKTTGNSAILTNDFGIVHAKKELLNRENMKRDKLRVFVREIEDRFKNVA